MEKIKLYGLGKSGNYSFYTFDKNKKVHKKLSEIIEEIFGISWFLTKTIEKENGETEMVDVDVNEYRDCHETLEIMKNEFETGKRIDVFYGDKRMFIIIHCPKELRKQFNKKLNEISEFP